MPTNVYVTPLAQEILSYLKSGKSLTHLEALGVFRTNRLAARVKELRNAGWDVVTKLHKDVKGKRYARYHLVMF